MSRLMRVQHNSTRRRRRHCIHFHHRHHTNRHHRRLNNLLRLNYHQYRKCLANQWHFLPVYLYHRLLQQFACRRDPVRHRTAGSP